MATYRIYAKGNYLYFFEDGTTEPRVDRTSNVVIFLTDDVSKEYRIASPNIGTRKFLLSEAKNESGIFYTEAQWLNFVNLNSSADELPRDYYIEARRGNIPGVSIVSISSHNPAVPTTGIADIWHTTGVLTYLQADTGFVAVSDNINDTAGGTGAREITIEMVDISGVEKTAVITMNGQTPTVATTEQGFRINRAYVTKVGTYGGKNIGKITITGAGQIQAVIFGGTVPDGRDHNSHFAMPSNKEGILLQYDVIVDAQKPARVYLNKRFDNDIVVAPFGPTSIESIEDGVTGSNGWHPKSGVIDIPPKTDTWFSAIATGASSAAVTVNYELMIFDV